MDFKLLDLVNAATLHEERRLEAELFGRSDSPASLPPKPLEFTCRFCVTLKHERPSAWCTQCKGSGGLHPDGWICAPCLSKHESTGEHDVIVTTPRVEVPPPEGVQLCSAKPLFVVQNVVSHASQAPAFGRHGHLVVPHGRNVSVYDLYTADGVVHHSQIVPGSIGLSQRTFVAACEPHSRVLLLADAVRGGSDVVALHVDTHSVIWRSSEFASSTGIAVLGEQGIAVASSEHHHSLHVHRLLDGVRIGSVPAVQSPSYVAAHAPLGFVYAASYTEKDGGSVRAFKWSGETGLVEQSAETARLAQSVLPARGRRPLAVMPPLHAHAATMGETSNAAYLIVAIMHTPYMHILSLPDLRCVAVLELEGKPAIVGLAADPGGATGGGRGRRGHAAAREPALVVCDAVSRSALVYRWPLSGVSMVPRA